ncbi:MAG TPA: TetR/AcrR family transcriptional regulator [Candidatus Pseudogracilibacillus intestinigallinarum]|uniref:TetR/AcrR family transcriptional regulator n=1 Tax=Candidatus Pseudogracilibacillus intestinigallinarum TaxID=2838742 RepID=A0A9D1PKM9_9BACI|nr:TetR/AcrR family transcriptional regulator [Candidatus Pseudogracilibacillus intestinigallinarum]
MDVEDNVVSSVKDESLITKRRHQIIKSAIQLFKEKGFHRTTTREIAQKCGFSIGTLYEYIRTKEDVLFLVYQSINERVYQHLREKVDLSDVSSSNIMDTIASYYRLVDEMQDEVIILYQEVKSLHTSKKEVVLQKERDMVELLTRAIYACYDDKVNEKEATLIANNIFVQGQMWAFRRWTLQKQYTIDEYIQMQLELFQKTVGLTTIYKEG